MFHTAKYEDHHRRPDWTIILAIIGLAVLIGLAIWASLTAEVSDHWPPPSIDW